MKERIPTAVRPGRTWGRTILVNICHSLAPSTIALSSTSTGSFWKKDRRNQMIKGTLIKMWASTIGVMVLMMPKDVIMM